MQLIAHLEPYRANRSICYNDTPTLALLFATCVMCTWLYSILVLFPAFCHLRESITLLSFSVTLDHSFPPPSRVFPGELNTLRMHIYYINEAETSEITACVVYCSSLRWPTTDNLSNTTVCAHTAYWRLDWSTLIPLAIIILLLAIYWLWLGILIYVVYWSMAKIHVLPCLQVTRFFYCSRKGWLGSRCAIILHKHL